MIKAKLNYYCEPRTTDAPYEVEDIHKFVDLPFIPFAGLMLKIDVGGDYLEVQEVFLDVSEGVDSIEIYFTEPQLLATWDSMNNAGWLLTGGDGGL
jgi:hypothetical protein